MQSKYPLMAKISGLAALLMAVGHAQAADVTITATSGPVTITQAGHPLPAAVAAKLNLPLEIRTGATGTMDLLQLGSTVHVGPNSVLILPEAAAAQGPVDKILQKAGYVLYNIKSRKEHPLAVETPYLVSVVKGTVFTIAVEDHATTVALMEGSLDISAPGVMEHVLLKPNESIHHAQGESRLSAHPTAPAAFSPAGEAPSLRNTSMPDSVGTTQMAQVARDFADAGAAVAPGALLASSRQASAVQSGTANASGSTSTGVTTSTSGGSVPGSTTFSTGSGSQSSSGAVSSTASGTTASAGSTGSAGNPGTTASSGSSAGTAVTVTLPTDTTTGSVGCNGKSNGTGKGKCLGHFKSSGG